MVDLFQAVMVKIGIWMYVINHIYILWIISKWKQWMNHIESSQNILKWFILKITIVTNTRIKIWTYWIYENTINLSHYKSIDEKYEFYGSLTKTNYFYILSIFVFFVHFVCTYCFHILHTHRSYTYWDLKFIFYSLNNTPCKPSYILLILII